jgi:16S rRNA (uracil1498-N3)-methyltransferase
VRQFVLPPSWDGGDFLTVCGREARRLSSVLRLEPGASFPALAPDGSACRCTILEAATSRILLSVTPVPKEIVCSSAPLPDVRAGKPGFLWSAKSAEASEAALQPTAGTLPSMVIGVGLLKGSKLDEVVRAATEAGVSAVIPLETERSMPVGTFGPRLERLRRLSREAIGQSGSAIPTRIEPAMSLRQFTELRAAAAVNSLGLYFHEAPLAESSIHRYCTSETQELFACVGPEGGFSASETSMLDLAGFRRVWLGPAVLRAETAAIFAIASIRIVCLERTSWSTSTYRE